MSAAAIPVTANEWTTEGEGALRRVSDVNVLRVAGSFYEMGRQHGVLLSDRIKTGPIPYFREHVERMVGRSALGPLSPVVWPAIQRLLGRRIAAAIPTFALETIRGIADGSGVPLQEFMDGCTMPDAFMWCAARTMQLSRRGPAMAHRLALELGCTSAIAWGDATGDGKLRHARNFDYYGVTAWPRTKTVIFHEPDEGQRYVSVAAAGVALGGATAMNEAGLTLTVHQHMFTDQTQLGGTPIGLVGDIVMREAENLDQAQRILESHKPIGCWTYLIADGNAREVLCFEENPNRHVAHRIGRDDGKTIFGYANIYLDRELGDTEVNLYGSYWRANHGRHARANQLLREKHGTLDAQGMADIVGDIGHPECRIRDSIAMVMTTGTVVFQPEDGLVWVGTGDAPTSRGTYEPFSLHSADHAPAAGTLTVSGPAAAEEAFDHYREAYGDYLDRHDLSSAQQHLDAARSRAPEQSVYHSVAGLMCLEAGDAAGAEERLTKAIDLGHPDPERVASFHLWRARARDLLDRRDEAKRDYRWVLGHYADRPVHDAARKGLRWAYSARRARRMNIDMALADVISP